jgi:hypothetical protein
MRVEKERVTENCVRAEDADLVRPLHRRLAMAPDHFLDFEYALRDVDRERDAALARRGMAVA